MTGSRAGGRLLIYGATGYTGRLLARAARDGDLAPVLCGRNEAALAELAASLGLDFRVAALGEVPGALRGVSVVLSAAGPFCSTSGALIEACLEAGAHYLDISGEIDSLEASREYHGRALAQGLMIMPGVGFDVVPSDCLAIHVASQVPEAAELAIGIAGLGLWSRGSAKTMFGLLSRVCRVRRAGLIETITPGSLKRDFDYGAGPSPSVAVGWGDVSSAYYSTGVPNVAVYFEQTPALSAALLLARTGGPIWDSAFVQSWLSLHSGFLPEGPTRAEREASQSVFVAEARGRDGRTARARLHTLEAYSLTPITARAICERVLAGDFEPGFQTPARVYGPDLIVGLPGVVREELPA
jgi:short subunit dehydrogenase-like uncharacterized protein